MDLEAEGLRRNNIPFSKFHKRSTTQTTATPANGPSLMFASPSNISLAGGLNLKASKAIVNTINPKVFTTNQSPQQSAELIVQSPSEDQSLFDKRTQMWKIQEGKPKVKAAEERKE